MRILSFITVVFVVALARLIPHPPNFTPLLAVALFAGAKAPSRWFAYALPVAALWLSDLVIGVHNLMLVIALALMAGTLIGEISERWLSGKSRFSKVFGWGLSGLLASVAFFFISNFAVWTTSGMYPHTSEGLWTCFVMALPFFPNQALSTWLFSGVAFGIWAGVKALRLSEAQARH